MKKIATLLVLFSLGLFSVAPMVGCGAGDDKKDDKTEKKADDKKEDKKEEAK